MNDGSPIVGVVARMRQRLAELPDELAHRRIFLGTYLRTTQAVGDAIARARFEDPAWVEDWDVKFAELYLEHFVRPRRDSTRELLIRARDRGEIAQETNLDLTLDLLYGPIYHRLLHGHAALTARFAQQVIDHVITPIRKSS